MSKLPILIEVENFLRETKYPPVQLGSHAVNNGLLVGRLRAGGGARLSYDTVMNLRSFMADYRAGKLPPPGKKRRRKKENSSVVS